MRIYTIYDNKAKDYSAPFFQRTDVNAVRTFAATVNNSQEGNTIHDAPADFDLYHIGSFDQNTGTITPVEPALIINGEKVKKQ